jgi:O-antigen/teichoic acid export membrane protein
MAWLVLPVWLWAWVWAPELLRVLFTANYEDGLPIFRIYLLVLPLRVAVYSVLFLAMNQTRLLLWGAALDLLLNIALSILLAGMVGPRGPAIATTAVTWLQTLFYLVAAAKAMRIPVTALLPWGDLIRALVAGSVAVLPTLGARWWMEGDLARVAATLGFAAAIVALFLSRKGTSPFRGPATVRR